MLKNFATADLLACAGCILLIWGAIYAVGQQLLGSADRSAVGFMITALGGWLT